MDISAKVDIYTYGFRRTDACASKSSCCGNESLELLVLEKNVVSPRKVKLEVRESNRPCFVHGALPW